MSSEVRPELPTASVGSSQAPTAAVDNSAPSATRPKSTYKSGKAVQTNGATSVGQALTESGVVIELPNGENLCCWSGYLCAGETGRLELDRSNILIPEPLTFALAAIGLAAARIRRSSVAGRDLQGV